jgi:hypothetical protein
VSFFALGQLTQVKYEQKIAAPLFRQYYYFGSHRKSAPVLDIRNFRDVMSMELTRKYNGLQLRRSCVVDYS